MIKGFKDLQDFFLPFNPVNSSAGVFRDRPVDLSPAKSFVIYGGDKKEKRSSGNVLGWKKAYEIFDTF